MVEIGEHMSARVVVHRVLPAIACLVIALGATACGSSSSSSSSSSGPSATTAANSSSGASGVATAAALVRKYEGPQQFVAPGPPFNCKSASGKKVFYISILLSIPFTQTLYQGTKEGLAKCGVAIIPYDAKGVTANVNTGIEQAITEKADAIILSGITTALVRPALADAASAHIPVVAVEQQDPGPLSPGNKPPGVVAGGGQGFSLPGKMMADWIIADSKGKANIVAIRTEGASDPINQAIAAGINSQLTTLCPSCKITYKLVPIANWANTLPTLTEDTIRSDPSVNYLLPVFDGMVLDMLPAVHLANAQSRVKIVSFNGTLSVMKSMAAGDVVGADAGNATLWEGWGQADQLMRVLTGHAPVDNQQDPERLFDANNVKAINLNAQESTWYDGTANYQKDYEHLWGLS